MNAPFFAFIGAKGGAGTSTLCVELAKAMHDETNVVLVDADFSGRRSAAILTDGVRYLDAARSEHGRHIAQARVSGTTLVEMADSYESSFTVNLAEVEEFAASLRGPGIVLVDVPLPFSATVRPFVVRATRFIVVTEPTLLGVTAARTLVNELRRFGIPPARIALVLASRSNNVTAARGEIERSVGVPVLAELPALGDRGFSRALSQLARDLRTIAPETTLAGLLASDSGQIRDRRVHRRDAGAIGSRSEERRV